MAPPKTSPSGLSPPKKTMKTNVAETSRIAYEEIKHELGQRQNQVYTAIDYCQRVRRLNHTNLELANMLGIPINQVTPRVHELRKLGLIEMAGKRKCSITGRLAMTWKIAVPQNTMTSMRGRMKI